MAIFKNNVFSSDDVDAAMNLLKSEFARSFPNRDLIFLLIGSYNKDYKSCLFSDVDILTIPVAETDKYIDFAALDKLCLAFREVALIVQKERGVYMVGFDMLATCRYGIDLARYDMADKEKCGLDEISAMPVNCVFYSTINSYFFRRYKLLKFWKEEYKYCTAIFGEGRSWDIFRSLEDKAKGRGLDADILQDISSAIMHIEGSYVDFRSNAFLPYSLLWRRSMNNLRSAVFHMERLLLKTNHGLDWLPQADAASDIKRLPEEVIRLKEGLDRFKINEKQIPGEEGMIRFYKEAIDALNMVLGSLH